MPLKLWEESISSLQPSRSAVTALAQNGKRRAVRRAAERDR